MALNSHSRRSESAYMLRTALARTLTARTVRPAITHKRFYAGGPPPLTHEFVQTRIMDVLANCDKVDAAKLTPEASFEKDLGLDSLDVVDALFYIEEEFTIQMPDHEADKITTVKEAVEYILKQPDAY